MIICCDKHSCYRVAYQNTINKPLRCVSPPLIRSGGRCMMGSVVGILSVPISEAWFYLSTIHIRWVSPWRPPNPRVLAYYSSHRAFIIKYYTIHVCVRTARHNQLTPTQPQGKTHGMRYDGRDTPNANKSSRKVIVCVRIAHRTKCGLFCIFCGGIEILPDHVHFVSTLRVDGFFVGIIVV